MTASQDQVSSAANQPKKHRIPRIPVPRYYRDDLQEPQQSMSQGQNGSIVESMTALSGSNAKQNTVHRIPRLPIPNNVKETPHEPSLTAADHHESRQEKVHDSANHPLSGSADELYYCEESDHTPHHSHHDKPITPIDLFTESESRDMMTHMPSEEALPIIPKFEEDGPDHEVQRRPSWVHTVFISSPLSQVTNYCSGSDSDGSDDSDDEVLPLIMPSEKPLPDKSKLLPALPGIAQAKRKPYQKVANTTESNLVERDPEVHRAGPSNSDPIVCTGDEAKEPHLTVKQRAKWLVNVDVDALFAAQNAEQLIKAKSQQRSLAVQHWKSIIGEDVRWTDPATLVPWYQLVTAIGAWFPITSLVYRKLSCSCRHQ